MRVLVLIKPVAQLDTAQFNEDYSIRRERSRHTVSFADGYALTLARDLKRSLGSVELIVMSMASQGQAPLLESLKAYDLDSLVHLCDSQFAKSDTLCTAYILSEAIVRLGPFDMILAGQQSTDSETGQVPAQVATFLGLPFLSSVAEIDTDSSDMLRCIRYTEDERQEIQAELPVCLSVLSKSRDLAPPSLRALARARQVETITLSNKDLGLMDTRIGVKGSPTEVLKCTKNQLDFRSAEWIHDPERGAEAIYDEISRIMKEEGDRVGEEVASGFGPPSLDEGVAVVSPLFDPLALETAFEILSHLAVQDRGARVIVFGSSLSDAQLHQFASAGARSVHHIHISTDLEDAAYARAIQNALEGESVHTVLGGATVRMRSIMSIVAVLTSSGLAADCTEFTFEDQTVLRVVRPTFGGDLEAVIGITSDLQMATVRPKAYAHRTVERPVPIPLYQSHAEGYRNRINITGRQALNQTAQQAMPIMFSVGNGVQDPVLRDRIFDFGFMRGASRVAVNAFGYDYSLQVGQTGRLVSSQLYVGFGIHGAFQHIVGIKQAFRIIAVNHDPKAPIFDYADIAVCCDVDDVVTRLEMLLSRHDGTMKGEAIL